MNRADLGGSNLFHTVTTTCKCVDNAFVSRLFRCEVLVDRIWFSPFPCKFTIQDLTPRCWPVVKLFTPDAQCTWLLTSLYPNDPTIAFGLCDLGLGFPEIGDVSIAEIESLRGNLGLPVERDLSFEATQSLDAYHKEARSSGYITV